MKLLMMALGWAGAATAGPVEKIVAWIALPAHERDIDSPALREPLNKDEAAQAVRLLGADRLARLAEQRKQEIAKKSFALDGKTLRWEEKIFGRAPADGRSLWISMHGGGGTRPVVNDRQWENQINLYRPAEGIYVAPRAPTDTWNLWHEAHIDLMFERVIEGYVAVHGVNPDKVFLMGYSAGGDGVWQLAPRMADRFAAAAMITGHPNEASLLGLRNLPFALFMGGEDSAYDRNKIAAERADELGHLAKADPGGYVHLARIFQGLGHWMDGLDKEALPWMAKFRRDPWPERIVWYQDDVTHDRFYWLKLPDLSAARAGQLITATVESQIIRIDGDIPPGTELTLSDRLLDLDLPITVFVNGNEAIPDSATRTAETIVRSLAERADLPAAATAIMALP